MCARPTSWVGGLWWQHHWVVGLDPKPLTTTTGSKSTSTPIPAAEPPVVEVTPPPDPTRHHYLS